MHKTAFFLFICRVAVPFPGLERLIVQSLKLLFYGGISLFKREKVIIPDGGKDPGRGKLHGTLCIWFVVRSLWPGRDNRRIVMIGHFLVGSGNDGFITGILGYSGLEVIRHNQTGYATKVLIGMDMAEDKVLRLHIPAEFRIYVSR